MKRREFLTLIGAAAAAYSAVLRALADTPQIIILHSGFPDRTPIHRLFEALRDLGYENGRTATIDLLAGEGDSNRLNTLAAQVAAQRPDVVIGLTSPAVLALQHAGLKSPIVFAFVPDPVGLGIVQSLARPGGNVTGVTYSEAVLGGKRLELLIDALPGARRVAVLWNRAFPANVALFESIREAALVHGIDLVSCEFGGLEDLVPAFAKARRAAAQAAIFISDNTMFGYRREIAALAVDHHLPSIHSFSPEAQDGGLMSFGPDLGESYRRAAALTDRILKGVRPADLPVEQPTKFELVVNLRTARALGIDLPAMLLARADEVIE